MREIINVQLGQCGNSVGQQFLEKVAQEHSISHEGKYTGTNDLLRERLNVYFNEHQSSTFTARTVLADLEPGTIDFVRGTALGRLYDPDNFVTDVGSASNNWAVGYYGKGFDTIERLMDCIRKQAECCDYLQGFQMLHSMGGGTGSGLGSLAVERIRGEYNDRLIQSFPVFPSAKVSDIVVEPYNVILALPRQIENVQLCNVIDNEALLSICTKRQKIQSPTYNSLNEIVSSAITNITCGLRFPGQVNSNLRKQAVNLIPFPRLHFFMNSVAPLGPASDKTKSLSPSEIINELYERSSLLCNVDPRHGRYLTVSMTLRGKLSSHQAESLCRNKITKNSSYFVEWVPDNIHLSLCDITPPGQSIFCVATGSNNAIQQPFKLYCERLTSLFRRKAYLHWYTAQGLDQMQITEAQSNVNDLVSEYSWGECCHCCQDEYDQEEEEEYK